MSISTIELEKATLTFEENQIVHLNIKAGQVIELDEVKQIFITINNAASEKKFRLLVTADENAALSPEARSFASSDASSDNIVADAVLVKHYSHEITANFFVRFNKPARPTRLFKRKPAAVDWLKTFKV